MEEKVLIKNKSNGTKFVFLILGIIAVFITLYIFSSLNVPFSDDMVMWVIPLLFAVLFLLMHFSISRCELTVTDKRVFGRALWGKSVSLPLDSISAVGMSSMQGIDVGTSSGRLKFKFISNYIEIHSTITNLIIKRQGNTAKSTSTTIVQNSDEADQLKKYKDLLDSGVITQEEFDAKKKQLLGL